MNDANATSSSPASRLRIAITGHRILRPTDYPIIEQAMYDLIVQNQLGSYSSPSIPTIPLIHAIYFGGAVGADTVALNYALDFKEKLLGHLDIPVLIAVLPDTLEAQHRSTHGITKRAGAIVELRHKITAENNFLSYYQRDCHMVDQANRLIAFWDGIPKGGTYNTIQYARQKNVEVEVKKVVGRNNNITAKLKGETPLS